MFQSISLCAHNICVCTKRKVVHVFFQDHIVVTHFVTNYKLSVNPIKLFCPFYSTQIRHDADGDCFETNTKLCAKGEAKDLKRSWNNLDNNITDLCEKGRLCENSYPVSFTRTNELKRKCINIFTCSYFVHDLSRAIGWSNGVQLESIFCSSDIQLFHDGTLSLYNNHKVSADFIP